LIKKTKLNNIVREKVRQRIKKKKEKKNVCEKRHITLEEHFLKEA
jgi:hypothetical protein